MNNENRTHDGRQLLARLLAAAAALVCEQAGHIRASSRISEGVCIHSKQLQHGADDVKFGPKRGRAKTFKDDSDKDYNTRLLGVYSS